jgi:hypothetical protein
MKAKVGMMHFAKNGWDGFNKSDRLQDHVGARPDSFHNTIVKR